MTGFLCQNIPAALVQQQYALRINHWVIDTCVFTGLSFQYTQIPQGEYTGLKTALKDTSQRAAHLSNDPADKIDRAQDLNLEAPIQ